MDDSNRIPLRCRGLVPPGIQQALPAYGSITESGHVDVDDLDITLVVPDDTDFDAGEHVEVSLGSDGHLFATTTEQRQREEYERKAQRYLKAREQRQRKKRRKREAEEFWSQYEIPFEYTVAIKGRRSGLLRGSSGTGRTSNTVEHLFVKESFEDGRLSREVPAHRQEDDRDGGVYLCKDEASFRFDDCTRRGSDGEAYLPPVTCKACLNLMKRWKTGEIDG